MEAKEIIIRLIDDGKITGEEASILFEAINTKQIYYWPYYKATTDDKPWWQNYQITANKDPEGYSLSSLGYSSEKPWTKTCDN